MADYVNSPLSGNNMVIAGGGKAPTNFSKLFIGAVVALCLSAVSTIIGIYLFCACYIALHKHTKEAPIFLVWLIITCALVYMSATMVYFCRRNLPVKTKKDDVEQGTPMQIFRRNKKPQVVEQRFTISSPKQPRGPMKTDPFKFGDPNPLNSCPVTESCTNLIEKPSPARLSWRYGIAY